MSLRKALLVLAAAAAVEMQEDSITVQVKLHSQEVQKFQILRSRSSALLIILVYPAFSRTMQWRY